MLEEGKKLFEDSKRIYEDEKLNITAADVNDNNNNDSNRELQIIEDIRNKAFEEAVLKFMQSNKLSKKLYLYGQEQRSGAIRRKAKVYEGRARMLIAFVFEVQGKFEESIDQCEMAYHILRDLDKAGLDSSKSEESTHKIFALGILWRCFCRLADYEKAIYYNNKYT